MEKNLPKNLPTEDCLSRLPESAEDPRLEEDSASAIASRLERLKSAALQAAAKRERLPQLLFWSLFRLEVEELRKMRLEKRQELQKLYGSDWL